VATALEVFMPYDSGAGSNVTEDGWRQMSQFWRGDGVIRRELSEFAVFGDSTGMQVKVPSGRCWIRGNYGHKTTQTTLPIAAAHATLGRRDLVILRNNFLTNQIELDVLTGTPASTPVYPSLTQNTSIWEIQVGQVVVGAAVATITAGNVTARQQFVDGSCSFGIDTGYQLVSTGTITQVDWDVEQFPSSGCIRSGSNGINAFTFSRVGFWDFTGSLEFAAQLGAGHSGANATAGRRAVWVDKTSPVTQDRRGYADLAPNVAGAPTALPFSGQINVTAVGQEFAVYCFHDAGSSLEITKGNGGASDYNTTRITWSWRG